ncbi:MAG TPA: DUF1592 domain-containing protein [Lacipirellulaceae bacterium]|nr:DUF1592 domain-containing protein [Lacipirellulaceae bacterium]
MRYVSLPLAAMTCLLAYAALFCPLSANGNVSAEGAKSAALAAKYDSEIRPLLARYCHKCHGGGDTIEGEINLAAMKTWDDAAKQPATWRLAAEMLGNRLMPPEDADQPTDVDRARLLEWVEGYLAIAAEARSGDPGRVVLRRLSNAEYTYTLRDLTGIDSLDPAREFPADGAAGEGFTNTGSALVMSPALVTKYLDAAKEVARHAVLLPDGFRFSPHATARDWTDEKLAQIREFYGRFTDAGGGSTVNLQGIVFDTNQGGRLPVEKYLAATLIEREALAAGRKTVEAAAMEHGLNAKYLGILWASLNGNDPSQLLDDLRSRWRAAKPEDTAALANHVAAWQKSLWTFSSVGLIGRVGGPKRWMEPVNPLATTQEIKFKIPESQEGADVAFSLVVTDAGDGGESDYVVWKSPRLVKEGQPDLLLRDIAAGADERESRDSDANQGVIGLKPDMFGRHPDGRAMEAADLCVQSPSVIKIRLPADLAAGREFVATCVLDTETGAEGSAQVAVVEGTQSLQAGLLQGEAKIGARSEVWSGGSPQVDNSAPILITEGSAAQRRLQSAFAAFRQLLPPALCYTKIVPVDEVISVTLFYREDDHLVRLMLDESQARELDRHWDELRFVSRDALASVDAFAQLLEFATQDADPKAFEPMRQPIHDRAAAFRQLLLESEPQQLEALLDFAALAYRRPLTADETTALSHLYRQLRKEEIPHEDAFRLTLARLLVSPAFLYHVEKPAAGMEQAPISDWELASRLSYFLWSSQPDVELRQAAAYGRLHEPDVLEAQTRRMLGDAKTRRLATEFACQWLHINDFEHLDEKSERHFPTFVGLRADMAEESVQFFTDLFQQNHSVLEILDADYTFLNESLAQHYGIPGVTGAEWRRVDGVKQHSRGGVLAQATVLAKQSGASRTSPILRGNWISEILLGERLPDPPKGVPPLPDDEAGTEELTVRQLVEKHVSDPKCAVCHQRIDPYGFSLEAFDAIGRHRTADLGGRPIDTRVTLMDGTQFDGLDGLRNYLLTERREAFVRQFCRKLLGYALGRAVQLSDEPLLAEMQNNLAAGDYKVDVAVDAIVGSRQFREMRGRDSKFEE